MPTHATPAANLHQRLYPFRILLAFCGVSAAALLLALLLFFVAGGLAGAFTAPGALLPLLAATACYTGAALLLCAPVGILASLFLHSASIHPSVGIIRWLLIFACGVPGVVWALAALAFLPRARAAGPCILILLVSLMLPRITLSSVQALAQVPAQVSRAAQALGAGTAEACATACFPGARRGIVRGILRAAICGAGEAAGVALILRAALAGAKGDTLASGAFSALWRGDIPFAQGAALALILLIVLLSMGQQLTWGREVQNREQELP